MKCQIVTFDILHQLQPCMWAHKHHLSRVRIRLLGFRDQKRQATCLVWVYGLHSYRGSINQVVEKIAVMGAAKRDDLKEVERDVCLSCAIHSSLLLNSPQFVRHAETDYTNKEALLVKGGEREEN